MFDNRRVELARGGLVGVVEATGMAVEMAAVVVAVCRRELLQLWQKS